MFINTIDPILFSYGFLTIRWYGIFLGVGVGLGLFVLTKIAQKKNINIEQILSLALWLIVGGLIGARLGHIIFYNLDYFLTNPLEVIMINHGGLSSHGMAIGLIVTFLIIIQAKKIAWRELINLLVIPIPLIAGFIRIGNFFNSEIVGKASTLPWAVQFPLYETNPIFRHPSQIYEALIAFTIFGILLFIQFRSQSLSSMKLTSFFIFLYFTSRFLIEFVKEYPTYAGLSMGQWLSIPFILFSIIFLLSKRQKFWF
ncbi:prolipoprotein diacylglyceryl transferase [Patescibacteria group bacterium]|nr:prolipoprotein diacylglyceryl transferase [Patescibacteria group bacterium]MCG2687913.1 prolipoprotein diacylglyceryl transferase [Candidatus Parcubacteria bacterium]